MSKPDVFLSVLVDECVVLSDVVDFDFVSFRDLGHGTFAAVYLFLGWSFQLIPIMDCRFQWEFRCFTDGLAAAIYYFLAITDSFMILYQHD